MTYAHISNGTIDAVGRPPDTSWAGGRWYDLRGRDPESLAACGWLPATEAQRPADTATTTWDAAWAIIAGTAIQSWVERPKTAEDLAATATEANRVTLDAKVRAAVQTGGTLASDIGATGAVAWTPGTPLTLRGYQAMTLAQTRALTLPQTQELLSKLAPILVDVATTTRRAAKFAVQIFDDSD